MWKVVGIVERVGCVRGVVKGVYLEDVFVGDRGLWGVGAVDWGLCVGLFDSVPGQFGGAVKPVFFLGSSLWHPSNCPYVHSFREGDAVE